MTLLPKKFEEANTCLVALSQLGDHRVRLQLKDIIGASAE